MFLGKIETHIKQAGCYAYSGAYTHQARNSRRVLQAIEDTHNRYFLNPAFDLLKLVPFFAAVNGDMEYENDPDDPVIRSIRVVDQKEWEVAGMYPDVNGWKDAEIRVYKSPQDA